jgi:hypothetical protein
MLITWFSSFHYWRSLKMILQEKDLWKDFDKNVCIPNHGFEMAAFAFIKAGA